MKFSNLLIILAAVSLLSFTAKAQEETPLVEGPDPAHRQMNFNEDKTLIDQPLQVQQHPGVRDSLTVITKPLTRVTRPEAPRDAPKHPRNEEDALRFNFLYYIIQKYKLADIVEHE